jgi:hypothetical protein
MGKRYVASKRHTIEVDYHPYMRELRRERRRRRVRGARGGGASSRASDRELQAT